MFGADAKAEPAAPIVDVKTLHAKIGDRRTDAGERFFRGSAQQGRAVERKEMIDRNHALSLTRQARALGISRGSIYYLPRPPSAADLALMHRIDRLHLDYPFAGMRMATALADFTSPR